MYSIPFAKLSDYSFIETLSKTLECNGTNIPLQLLIGDVINTVSQTKFYRDGKDKSNSSETFFFYPAETNTLRGLILIKKK